MEMARVLLSCHRRILLCLQRRVTRLVKGVVEATAGVTAAAWIPALGVLFFTKNDNLV